MKKNTALKRHKDKVHQKRKANIVKNVWQGTSHLLESEVFHGKLVKGKVHCSCDICSYSKEEYKKNLKRKEPLIEKDMF